MEDIIMSAFNDLTLIGRVVREPKTFAHEKGTSVIFDLAVERPDGKTVDWLTCSGFISLEHPTKVYDYIHKGTQIVVKGEVHSYKDKNNYTQMQLSVSRIGLLGNSKNNAAQTTQNTNDASLDQTAPQDNQTGSVIDEEEENRHLQEQIENLPLGK